ncbi:VOC family protein [Streptomyces sp. PTM05]|uniref:VOC family protein n=1 Tax=Streptantibioticus parmotrematis TaxID=2873249 RepID=A0ABS7QLH0_9ACTN|nr:VOC family protein [Streptantibioticus parmotrematis]MBY8883606.1 VOC family protein [Streptantibioticus parmotrematis]
MAILKTYARLWSEDLDAALPPLVELVGEEPHLRLPFGEVELGAIGDFLVIAATPQAAANLPRATATVVVSDLGETQAMLASHGAEVTFGPTQGPTGSYFYARHADGSEVEYVQWRPELVARILT